MNNEAGNGGKGLSRFDGDISAASEASIELEELLAAFGSVAVAGSSRSDAMAQFLSGAEGWRDARKALRGAFAGTTATGPGLTGGKDK